MTSAIFALVPLLVIAGVMTLAIRSNSEHAVSPWSFAATESELQYESTPAGPRLSTEIDGHAICIVVPEGHPAKVSIETGVDPGIWITRGANPSALATDLFPVDAPEVTGDETAILSALSLDARAALMPLLKQGAVLEGGVLRWTVPGLRPAPQHLKALLAEASALCAALTEETQIARALSNRVLDIDDTLGVRSRSLEFLVEAHPDHADTTSTCLQLIRHPGTEGALLGPALLYLARQGAPVVARVLPKALQDPDSRDHAIAACVAARHRPSADIIAAWLRTTVDGPLVRDVVSTWPDARFEPLLLDLIETDLSPPSRVAIVQALGIVASSDAVPRLRVQASRGSGRERNAVDAAIGLIQSRLASSPRSAPRA